jgi:hypothetical protein
LLGLPPGAYALVVGGLPRAAAAFGFGYAEELVLECTPLLAWRFALLRPETLGGFTLVEFCFLSFARGFPVLNSV